MKKIIIPAISLAALLLTGACSIDERTSGDNGNEAMLTLNMGLDGAVQTRAIGDGTGANKLVYAVFDETGTRIEGIKKVSKEVSFPTTETITLAKGQTYMIAFWAQNKACTAYEVSDDMVVTINYKGALSNDERRDAFFKTVKVTVTGDEELDVELTRPFAQLNVGIYESDWTAGEAAGIVISKSKAVVKQAASTLNLLEGTVGTPVDVTFDFAAIPAEALSVDLNGDGTAETYKYLSMNYILPLDGTTGDASTTLSDLEFTFSPLNGNNITLTQGLDAVPVQRNWRTNIIGQILSGDLSLNISIDPGFNGDNNHEIWDGSAEKPETDPDDANTYLITTPAELAWVAEQVNSKTEYFAGKTIKLMNDIDLSGSYWTPVGNVDDYPTVTFKGTFDGQNHVISNLTASDDATGHAAAGLFGSILGTVKNVTLKDVNIRSTHYAGAVVGYSSMNGAIIENCHVDGGTITSVPENTGSAYDNGDKAGGIIGYYVAGDKVTDCSAKNLTITAYRDLGGITGCGPQSGMTDCSVENIILVQDNTNGYESEAITTVGALGGRDVTNGDQPYDGTFASAVTKKVVGNISDAQNLINALQSDAPVNITLTENVEVTGDLVVPADATLNLNGKTLTAKRIQAANDNSVIAITNGTVEFSGTGNGVELFAGNSTLTLDGVTLNASNLSGMAVCCGGIKYPEWAGNTIVIKNSTINAEQNGAVGIQLENAHNLTIENSTINHDYFGINQNGTNPGSTITLKDCNISGTYSGIYLSNYAGGTKNTLKVEGGKIHSEEESAIEVKKTDISVTSATLSSDASEQTYSVNGSGSNSTGYGIVLAGYAVGTPYEGETNFTDNTFDLAAGKDAVGILRYDGETGAAVISSNEELAAAAIADNATIYLTKGEYIIPAAAKGKTVTFIGTGNPEDVKVAVTNVGGGYENCDYGLDGSNATFEGITITTNSSTYIGYARCNGTYTLYGESIFDNCEFNVSGDVYNIWTWGAKEIEFTGCTFNSDGKALLLYQEDDATVTLTVTDCIFNDKGGLDSKKAAIEIGDSSNKQAIYNVTVSKTKVNGYEINDEGINTGTTLWGNKNSMPEDRLNVTIDGDVVY